MAEAVTASSHVQTQDASLWVLRNGQSCRMCVTVLLDLLHTDRFRNTHSLRWRLEPGDRSCVWWPLSNKVIGHSMHSLIKLKQVMIT